VFRGVDRPLRPKTLAIIGASDSSRGGWARSHDVDALVQATTGLSHLFIDHRGWLSEIEIDPLTVLAAGHGVLAVDVRMMERKP
jgi:porphobilinogen deaminase